MKQSDSQKQPLNTTSNNMFFGNGSDINGGAFSNNNNGNGNTNGNGFTNNNNTGPEWQQYRSPPHNNPNYNNHDDGTISGGDSVSLAAPHNVATATPPTSRPHTPGGVNNNNTTHPNNMAELAQGPLALGDVDTDAVDEMLSREIADMSFQDRNAINEEVHGVRNLASVESPAMLQKSLWLFQLQLQRVDYKPACDHAVYVLQSQWVMQDPTLKLRCLRAERFDIVKAVRRFVRYLDLLQEYYGPEALLRPIRMSDLGKESLEILKKGEYQLLPFRDRSGRKIIACLGDAGMTYSMYARVSSSIVARMRQMFGSIDDNLFSYIAFLLFFLQHKFFIYFWWVAGEDVETQQKGLISVFWPETHNFPDKREAEEAERIFAAVPIRITALHQCLPDSPAARLVKAVISLSLDVETRTRMKFHSGACLFDCTFFFKKILAYESSHNLSLHWTKQAKILKCITN